MSNVVKMDPRVKGLWVNELRSGKYKQGTGNLVNTAEGTHCCLGVLCEIAVSEGVIDFMPQAVYDNQAGDYTKPDGSVIENGDLISTDGVMFYDPNVADPGTVCSDAVLFKAVNEWAGIDTGEYSIHTSASPKVMIGQVGEDISYQTLFDLNDGGESFDEIANKIEDQL